MVAPDQLDPERLGVTDRVDGAARDGLGVLQRYGQRESWPSRTTLLRQGERPARLFVIEHGQVELWDETTSETRLTQIIHPGASVGDMAVLLDRPAPFTAVTRGAATTLGFTKQMVHDLLELDPQACFLWMHLLSRRIESGYSRNVAVAGRAALERLGLFLLGEAQAAGDGAVEVTQSELASATGLSRQHVSRVLGSLERLGVLERGRGCIRILDRDRLRALIPR